VYTPSQLRDILRNSSTGTKSNDPTFDKLDVLSNLSNDSSIGFPEEQKINKGNEGSTIKSLKEGSANSEGGPSFNFP
ncbi:peptidase S8, partial [Bacillus thuringiensis]